MRIVAGKWRGRRLVSPPGAATRPTADRVREALFSMLASRLGSLEGLRVADLFAGSGALGLEALSRGAAHCTFVDSDRGAIETIRANIAALGATADVIVGDATRAHIAGPLDLALLDAPYGSGLAGPALAHLPLGAEGLASVETARNESVAADGYAPEAMRTYGKARITLLRRLPRPSPDALA